MKENKVEIQPNLSMRAVFAQEIYSQMEKNENIWVLVGDLGYKMWDRVRQDFSDRFINTGAAEQSLVGIAVGLALKGKIPIVYSITTFLLFRPFETIRNYLHNEQIPVKLIGSGRDKDYFHDGYSHWPLEEREIMKKLNIESHWPESNEEIPKLVEKMIKSNKPWYINLKR